MDILSVILIGFLYGLKHAFEPDHVVTISAIVSKSKSVVSTVMIGTIWGLANVITLFIVGILLVVLKQQIPENILTILEIIVGLFLIYIGISAIRNKQVHLHHELDFRKMRLRSIFIGFIHGLIGSTVMILLVTTEAMSKANSIINILGYGLGTFIGIVGFTFIIGLPFVLTSSNEKTHKLLSIVTGFISILFGLMILYHVSVNNLLINI